MPFAARPARLACLAPLTALFFVALGACGDTETVADLIALLGYPVVVTTRRSLGTINHTLLTFEALKSRKIEVAGIIFSGDENKATEEIILSKTKAKCIGRIENEPYFDENVIQYYADIFKNVLLDKAPQKARKQ